MAIHYPFSPIVISIWKRMGLDGIQKLFENKATKSNVDTTEPSTENFDAFIGQVRDCQLEFDCIEVDSKRG
ncbi:MAG: hypothetical protein OXE77_04040 [Flavobacteriaceae bacterium]|nr:hypothetical protein [Flavobacteriaceae bacterium]MCY4266520.1 hypothetical protein [Flavobacteriaceae bacterium]